MILPYDRLYFKKGLRKDAHFLKPRILNPNDWYFCFDANVHYYNIDNENEELLDNTVIYLMNANHGIVHFVEDYSEDAKYGHYLKRLVRVSQIINDSKKHFPVFKYPKGNVPKVNKKTIYVLSYSLLNSKYKYPNQQFLSYSKFRNYFTTVLENFISFNYGEHKFLPINMPSELLSRNLYERLSKKMTNANLHFFENSNSYIILELWKYFTPELKEHSVFNVIKKEDIDKVNFLFIKDNKMVLINFAILLSALEDSGFESENIRKRNLKTFKRLFYIFLVRFYTLSGMTDDELEKHDEKIENDTVTDDQIKDILANDKDILNIDKKEEQQNKSIDNLSKLAKIFSPKNTENEIINSLNEQQLEDKLDIRENETELLDKDIVNATNMEKVNDEVDNINLLNISSNENQISLEHINIDNIHNQEINYNAPREYIQKQVDDKLMLKQRAKTILEVLDKQQTDMSPYGNELLKDTLNSKLDYLSINKPKVKVTPTNVVFNQDFNHNKVNTVVEEYIKNLYKKDITRVFYSLQNIGFVVRDYQITQKIDGLEKTEQHRVEYITPNGKSATINIFLPILTEDGKYYNNGIYKMMRWQMGNTNLIKSDYNNVKLSTYYGKINLYKGNYSKNNFGYWLLKQINKKYFEKDGVKVLILGFSINTGDEKLPTLYTAFARYISSMDYNGYNFDFNRRSIIENNEDYKVIESKTKGIIIGKHNNNKLILINNNLYEYDKELHDLGDLLEFLNLDISEAPLEYTSIKVFKLYLPLASVLMYYLGISKLLKLLNIKFKLADNKRPKLLNTEIKITFSDKILIVTKDKKYDLIINGLASTNKILSNYTFEQCDDKNYIANYLSDLGVNQPVLNEIQCLEKLFIDPVSQEVLRTNHLPTNTISLLLKANEELIEDDFDSPSQMKNYYLKGYERIAGMLYNYLVKAARNYLQIANYAKASMKIPPFAIINEINNDSTSTLVEDLNPMAYIKNREDTTLLGFGGYGDRTVINLDTREFNKSQLGIISEATRDSALTGIATYLSANPQLSNLRGQPLLDNKDNIDNNANVYSSSALLSPFVLHDDGARLNFASVMNGHIIPIKNKRLWGVRTGYESIIPIKAGKKFVVTAEDNGIVRKVSNDSVSVEYFKKAFIIGKNNSSLNSLLVKKGYEVSVYDNIIHNEIPLLSNDEVYIITPDGKNYIHDIVIRNTQAKIIIITNEKLEYNKQVTIIDSNVINNTVIEKISKLLTNIKPVIKDYSIKNWTTKEESGTCYTHEMVANVKVGDKVIKDDTLIYDSMFFDKDIFNPKRVVYVPGTQLTVALIEDIETNEDSSAISEEISKQLGTSITKVKSLIINKTDAVFDLVKVGQEVTDDSTLCSVINDFDDDGLSKEQLAIIKSIQTMAPKAKVNGKVSKIEIRYNCPFKDLSSSLKKVIKQTDEHMINTYGYTGEVLTNNYTFEGKPLVEGQVQIKIYIISNINFTTADKGVWGNQMKFVISRVFDEDIYTEDGTKIDAKFSFRSINNRIAGSPLLLGTTCMVLEKLTDKITEMYFE